MVTDETASKLVSDRLEQIMSRWMWTGTDWRTVESLVRERIATQVAWYGKGTSFSELFDVVAGGVRDGVLWVPAPYPQQAGGPSPFDR